MIQSYLVLLFSFFLPLDQPHAAGAVFDEILYRRYFDGEVTIWELSKRGSPYGHAVWLDRAPKNIKAKFMAIGEPYARFERWRNYSDADIIALCSAAPSEGADRTGDIPLGLTVEDGEVINDRFEEEMDALVLVEPIGGIRVSDVKNGDFFIEPYRREFNLKNPGERAKVLEWAVDQSANFFQAYLLAWKNSIRLSALHTDEARQNKERRAFALVKDRSQRLYHVIIDIREAIDLETMAFEALEYLNGQKEMNVIAIVSLDTGPNDFFMVFDQDGRQLSVLDGAANRNIDYASNLLVWRREK